MEYLNQYNLEEGYLLIFDFRKTESSSGENKVTDIQICNQNKKITEIYC